MADITVTAADVRPLPGALVVRLPAAEAIDLGEAVYVNGSGQAALADADADASSRILGICVSAPDGAAAAATGDTIDVLYMGRMTGFSGMTPGGIAYASTTAGALADAAPAGASGDYLHVAGTALSATVLLVNPFTADFAAQ